ncbi:MAG: RNA methyltransferase [bacterium]|nr:RNA methyltransferase [bacterium]
MLSSAQEKLIRSLHTNKGREKADRCLVEGKKIIEIAGAFVDFTFSETDSRDFAKLVTTVTPQMEAAVAHIPSFDIESVAQKNIILILDGVQDPGNVGSILRLCLGFDAGVILVDSADPTNPKVIRSSAGAFFQIPWVRVSRSDISGELINLQRTILRLEKRSGSKEIQTLKMNKPIAILVGSEGQGIHIQTENAESIYIQHNPKLESLNVASALAIALYTLSTHSS